MDSLSSDRAEIFGVCLTVACFAVSFFIEAIYCWHKIKTYERAQIELADVTQPSIASPMVNAEQYMYV